MYAPTRDELRQLLEIIASLHHGDSSRRIREQVAQAMLELLRADYLASYVRNAATGRFEDCVAVNIGADSLALYDDYFQFRDPITPLLAPCQATLVASVISQRALEKTEFFNDFLIRGGLHHGIDLHLHEHERHLGDLRIWRARSEPPFGAREVALLELLKPHLTHALTQLAVLERERASGASWQTLWAEHPNPCFIVDSDGVPLQRNRSADALLERTDAAHQARLERTLAQGARAAGGELPWGDYLASCARIDGATPGRTLIQLLPQRAEAPAPSASASPDLGRVFGLTQRETDVCALILQGYSDKEISRRLAISFPTVRTHLSHAFSKAGVTSRAELIHRVACRTQ
jgi:DNA-binding CsgD family transcriptional regulator